MRQDDWLVQLSEAEYVGEPAVQCVFPLRYGTLGKRNHHSDDREEPFETLIKLDDGRVVRGTECQYSCGTVAQGVRE